MSLNGEIIEMRLAVSLRDYIKMHGVKVPEGKELVMTTGEIDTDKQQLTIGYMFVDLPIIEENEK